jgi:hypothetical protein
MEYIGEVKTRRRTTRTRTTTTTISKDYESSSNLKTALGARMCRSANNVLSESGRLEHESILHRHIAKDPQVTGCSALDLVWK